MASSQQETLLNWFLAVLGLAGVISVHHDVDLCPDRRVYSIIHPILSGQKSLVALASATTKVRKKP